MYYSSCAKDILHLIFLCSFLIAVAATSHLRGEENHHEESRGLTSPVLQLPDPKSVNHKSEIEKAVGEWKYPLNPKTLQRPLRILAFGGSTTWGASLDNRHQAYPWLLGEPYIDYVDNLAVRATGADYPSICLESMIPDAETKNYDVILLEFSMAWSNGLPLLMKRLRERYPEAVIVVVHLWSIAALAKDEATGMGPRDLGGNFFHKQENGLHVSWMWVNGDETYNPYGENCGQEICKIALLEQLVEEAGGYIYKLPLPQTPKIAIDSGWFNKDWVHLSPLGHCVVADGIFDLLSQHQTDIFKQKRLGSFGLGDQCYSWFTGREVNLKYDGVNHTILGSMENSEKWVLEVDPVNGGRLAFESKFSSPVPVGLSYMSKQEGSNYTVIEVHLNYGKPVIIDPNYNHAGVGSSVHISVLYQIGFSQPGKNVISITTLEQRGKPFRITGVFLCGVCVETGNLGIGVEPPPLELGWYNPKAVPLKNNKPSSGRHIFYCVMQPDPKRSTFKMNLDIAKAAIRTTAERLHPDWNVHLIVDGDDVIRQMSSLSDSNIELVDYRDAAFSHRLARFKRAYIHQSPNDRLHEMFCMYRWIIIFEYASYLQMSGVELHHILTADTDLVVLENPLLVDKLVEWKRTESYRIVDGAAIMWTLEGLQSFVEFLIDMYSSPQKAAEIILKEGEKFRCVEEKALLVPCYMEDGAMIMRFASDMIWYNIWAGQNAELRVRKYTSDCVVIHNFNAPGQQYHFIRNGSSIDLKTGHSEVSKVCIIHFQGRLSKQLALPFMSFVSGESPDFFINTDP